MPSLAKLFLLTAALCVCAHAEAKSLLHAAGLSLQTASAAQGVPTSKAQATSSPRVYLCSKIGCPSDGVTPIDALVQPLLASATSSSPVTLVLDGPLFMTCGLYIADAGYTEISGLGASATRLKILAHCNQHVLRVGADPNGPTDTGIILPQTAAQIYIHSLTLDGNRGDGYSYPLSTGKSVGNGNSTTPDQRGYFYGQNGQTGPSRILSDLDITNAHDVWVDDVTFENAPCYSFRASNTTNLRVTNDRFMPFGTNLPTINTNTDGMHFSGYTRDAVIDNVYCRTGDDCIAFNAPEGSGGDIQNVRLSNLTLDQAQTGVRIYAFAQNRAFGIIDHLDINGVTGSANENVFTIGLEMQHPQTYLDVIRNVTIENVHVAAPIFMWVNDSIESMQISDSVWKGSPRAVGMIQAWYNDTTWGKLSLVNCGILRDPKANSSNSIIDGVSRFNGTSLTIKQLDITNFTVQDVGSSSSDAADYGHIAILNIKPGTTVGVMKTSNLSKTINRLLDVDGVPATNWQFYSAFPGQTQAAPALPRLPASNNLGGIGGGFFPGIGMGTPMSNNSGGSAQNSSSDSGSASSTPSASQYTPPVDRTSAIRIGTPIPATHDMASRTASPNQSVPTVIAAKVKKDSDSAAHAGSQIVVASADRFASPATKVTPAARPGKASSRKKLRRTAAVRPVKQPSIRVTGPAAHHSNAQARRSGQVRKA